MSDTIGRITVPDLAPSGTFPITPEWGYSTVDEPRVVTHQFGSANAKIEQRYTLGPTLKRFSARAEMNESQRQALRDFWEARQGALQPFTLNWPTADGSGTEAYTARFDEAPLGWEYISDALSTCGLTLLEVQTTTPEYAVTATQSRFPSGALPAALLAQVQELIPLVRIRVREAAVPDIYLSDRRVIVGGQLYVPRLLGLPSGISQKIAVSSEDPGGADQARFVLGNADRVMRDLAADTNLLHAEISFSLFHVGSGIKLDLWTGDITGWDGEAASEFAITASDGCYEITQQYPLRAASRSCPKPFGVAAQGCPFVSGLDLVHFPGASADSCDRSFDGPNGCLAHGMKLYFGGILAKPQGVGNLKWTGSSGGVRMTATSQVAETLYSPGTVIPEIYTDVPMPCPCLLAAGREENDYYEAMGVVGEGPIGSFSADPTQHTLDGQPPHGPGSLGLRLITGTDPAGATDFFSLDQGGDQTGGDFRKVYSGSSTYEDTFAAGTAFAVIRRTDAKGMQLSKATDHQMQVTVATGLGGWIWLIDGTRAWASALTNPVWIAVNMYLRGKGLWYADAAAQTAAGGIDWQAAYNSAAVCDETVTAIVGAGDETQFKFVGRIAEPKPLRDWIQEVLMNCLGYYTFANGKLRIGLRINSSTVEAFTAGNILFGSLNTGPIQPTFNRLTGRFGNKDIQFQADSQPWADFEHAQEIAAAGGGPQWLTGTVNYSGASTRSQVARLITVRGREEVGGITAAERRAARYLSFKTTVLALNTEPGMVCSLTHADMPNGAGEFRVTAWRLNQDYSIDITGRTVTDSMYDLTAGPKPADVQPDEVPGEAISGLVPGDVQPIGADPFLCAITEDGLSATATIEYDPPADLSVFYGVVAHWVPDGATAEASAVSFQYNGDPSAPAGDAARHGTLKFVIPQPNGTEQAGSICLTPRSRAYAKPLVLPGTDGESPHVAVTIHTATVAGAVPGNPTLVSVKLLGYFVEGGKRKVRYGLKATPPDPLGTYAGLHLYVEAPDGSGQPRKGLGEWVLGTDALSNEFAPLDLGKQPYRESDLYAAVFVLDEPKTEMTARAYGVPYSTAIENKLVAADQVGASPSITFAVAPEPIGIQGMEYAGLVAASDAGHVQELRGGVWYDVFRPTWTGPNDGYFDHCIVIIKDLAGNQLDGGWSNPGDGKTPSNWFPSPAKVTPALMYFCSAAAGDGKINSIVEGLTPCLQVTVGRADGVLDLAKATPATLETAAFAAGIEPVGVVNQAPDGNGQLAIAKTTSAVYNTNDKKLYRWDDSISKYRRKAGVGDFEADSVTAGIVAAGAIRTRELATEEILIGAGGSKCPRFRVNDGSGNMIAFIGSNDAGSVFNWFQNIRIGPNINDPNILGGSSGLTIKNAPLTLTLNNVETKIDNTNDPQTSTGAGLRVRSTVTQERTVVVPKGVVIYNSDGTLRYKIADSQIVMCDSNGYTRAEISANSPYYIKLNNYQVLTVPQPAPTDPAPITSQTAGDSYTANEKNMLNYLKIDMLDIADQLTTLIASLKTHGLIRTGGGA